MRDGNRTGNEAVLDDNDNDDVDDDDDDDMYWKKRAMKRRISYLLNTYDEHVIKTKILHTLNLLHSSGTEKRKMFSSDEYKLKRISWMWMGYNGCNKYMQCT